MSSLQTATLGGGCFWCLDAVFCKIRGVVKVESGYCGGRTSDPTYEQICTSQTGHAEVVQVVFDADEISFAELLQIFFAIHDPTTLNRQGNDIGTQYRSVIFYHDEQQRQQGEAAIAAAGALWDAPVVTELAALAPYYPAEDYHQDYFTQHPGQGYCEFVVAPKVVKARQMFAARWQN